MISVKVWFVLLNRTIFGDLNLCFSFCRRALRHLTPCLGMKKVIFSYIHKMFPKVHSIFREFEWWWLPTKKGFLYLDFEMHIYYSPFEKVIMSIQFSKNLKMFNFLIDITDSMLFLRKIDLLSKLTTKIKKNKTMLSSNS
jgi:hypothetical protein